MRIVTWNCCRGPALRKLPALAALEPTLSIIQECPRPLSTDSSMLWFGDNPRQGIAVIASSGYRISAVEPRPVPRYTFPIQVDGPVSFLLLAVWSQRNDDFSYVRAVIRAVDCYRDLIMAQPTVVVGDLNSNTIWDFKRPEAKNHTGLVRQLAALGLASAYHRFFGEAQGEESRPTLYLHRNPTKPYHIDYCFIPEGWVGYLRSVSVGTDNPWAHFSDHRPLVVELALPEQPDPQIQRPAIRSR